MNWWWAPAGRIYDMTTHDYSPYDSYWPLTAGKPDFLHTTDTREITTQDGFYLTTRLSLADPLKLILGGRLDWYDYDAHGSNASDYKVTRNLTRYAGLIYELDDQHSVYVSYSDIFTPQRAKDTAGTPVKPIVGKNYEVGIKGEYLGGALNARRGAVPCRPAKPRHQSDRAKLPTDRVLRSLRRDPQPGYRLRTARRADRQLAGRRWLHLRANPHTIKDDANPQKVNQQFDTDTPEHLFKLTTRYNLQGPLEKFRVGGNISWQSRMYNDIALANGSSYRLQQGAYAVTDLMAGYKVNEHIDLQLNANNIFDRRYYSTIANSADYGGDAYGNPRNMMLTAKYTFWTDRHRYLPNFR